jgi:hypothetical protein
VDRAGRVRGLARWLRVRGVRCILRGLFRAGRVELRVDRVAVRDLLRVDRGQAFRHGQDSVRGQAARVDREARPLV